jgi:hypothetical protein
MAASVTWSNYRWPPWTYARRDRFSSMTSEQATFLLNDVYLPQIRNEHKTTRRVIEAVPADKSG